jgi:hypothetical protein
VDVDDTGFFQVSVIIVQSHVGDFGEGVKAAVCLKVKLKANSSLDSKPEGGHDLLQVKVHGHEDSQQQEYHALTPVGDELDVGGTVAPLAAVFVATVHGSLLSIITSAASLHWSMVIWSASVSQARIRRNASV